MTQVDGGGVPEGTQLNGIYEIEKRIAVGGMGEVYIGRVIQTGDKVAIKMILPEHSGNGMIVDLFRREASTLHNLYHEAIVRYFVFSVDPVLNRPYLSMEFADGPALGDRVRGGPLNEAELTVLRRRVAGGLHAAHRLGIIHRDISPDNIILVGGAVEKAKIIDFGIAKSQANDRTLIGSGFAGKLNYVSPEQLGLAGGEVTPKSDIYALGLVFAQAATGRPLPMGGSHAEVIDKRRVVPPLDDVPAFIRPLIEAMVQPDPADRPADMQAVADWEPSGKARAAAPARGAGAPVHPRERRRQQGGGAEEKAGRPWRWIVLGGGAIGAAAVVAALFFGQQAPHPSPGPDISPELAAASEAPPATVGEAYAWTLPPFDLPAGAAGVTLRAKGGLPPGLTVAPGPGASARIAGTPTEAGAFDFDVLASTPSGNSAWHQVRLLVRDLAVPTADPSPPAPDQAAGGAAAPEGPASVGDAADELTGAPAEAPAAGPGAGGVEPSVATINSGHLPQPSGGDESAAAGGSDAAPALPDATTLGSHTPPRTGAQTGAQSGAGALPRIPAGDAVPVAGPGEPSVVTGGPADVAGVGTPGEGTSVAASSQGGATVPKTGQPQRPAGGAPASGITTVAIPAPENRPPTLRDPVGGRIDMVEGQEVNDRLGVFDDEEGAAALRLDLHGTLPRGVSLRLAAGGIVQLYGTPAEYGDFDLRIAAVDPQDLLSPPITVTLEVEPPSETRAVRDYVLGYDGGECFLSRPTELGPQLARIEVFAAESRVQPVLDFDAAFKRDLGFEALIGMRPISEAQCALIAGLDELGPQALDNALAITLDRDEPAAGETISGTIRGGEGARLFVSDEKGALTDLSGSVHTDDAGTSFAVLVTGAGPRILIAARPRAGAASLPPSASLGDLLGAARRGDAALALGFFFAKG